MKANFVRGCFLWTLGVLGGAISRDRGFIEEMTMKRFVRAVELMHLIPKLRDL
jgi:hypothetical protein